MLPGDTIATKTTYRQRLLHHATNLVLALTEGADPFILFAAQVGMGMQTSSSAATFRPRARHANRTRKEPGMSESDMFIPLTDAELEVVAGGQSKVSITLNGSASGPMTASVVATATGTSASVGGKTPSQSATLKGSLTVTSA